jgi:hypothetical protein
MEIVSFKLINGAEIIGKLADASIHSDFINAQDAFYLDDALMVGIRAVEGGNATLILAPVTGIGDNPVEDKGHLPFALYKSSIMGQFPLSPEVMKAYRERVSGLLLVR